MTTPDKPERSVTLDRSGLAALLAHHADVLAARWHAAAPGPGAWEITAALSLTSHANDLTGEEETPAVTELLDNIIDYGDDATAPTAKEVPGA